MDVHPTKKGINRYWSIPISICQLNHSRRLIPTDLESVALHDALHNSTHRLGNVQPDYWAVGFRSQGRSWVPCSTTLQVPNVCLRRANHQPRAGKSVLPWGPFLSWWSLMTAFKPWQPTAECWQQLAWSTTILIILEADFQLSIKDSILQNWPQNQSGLHSSSQTEVHQTCRQYGSVRGFLIWTLRTAPTCPCPQLLHVEWT